MFVDGDFKSGKGTCSSHCSPSCHPAQTGGESGKEWFYGCTHNAWPQNRAGDFVPIVFCGGETSKCELIGKKFVVHYLRGLRARISNANKKVAKLNAQVNELCMLVEKQQ